MSLDMVINGQLEPNWSRASIYAGSLNFRVEFSGGGEAEYNHLRPVRGYQTGGTFPEHLDMVPTVTTRYSTWKAMFPNTHSWCDPSKTATPIDYQRQGGNWVYIGCLGCDLIYFAEDTFTPTRFVSNNVISPNEAAYTKKIAVVHDKGLQWSIVFVRENVAGRAELTFDIDNTTGTPFSMKDAQTGSTWDLTGKCVSGALSGQQLEWYNYFYRANQTVYNGYNNQRLYEPGDMRELVVKDAATVALEKAAAAGLTAVLNVAPNPVDLRTRITWSLPGAHAGQKAGLRIYNTRGKMVKEFSGAHSVQWDGTDNRNAPLAPGVYILKLETGKDRLAKRIFLLK